MKQRFLLVLFLFIPFLSFSKEKKGNEGYDIQVEIPAFKEQKAFLGRYVMGKPYSKDSIVLDKKGKGAFKGDENLEEGLFLIYFPNSKYFDFLISDDQKFSIKVDTTNLPLNIQFTGVEETKDSYDYTKFLIDNQKEHTAKVEAKKTLTDSIQINAIDAEISLLGVQLTMKQDELIAKYPKGMLSVFLKGLRMPQEPDYQVTSSNNPDSLKMRFRYEFYKEHYFDNVNLSDQRYYHTPYVKNNLDTYLNKLLIQTPDSIIPSALALVEKSGASDKSFQFMVNYMLDYAVKSKIMGMDKLMVELGNRYYLAGKTPWADSTLLSNLKKEIKKVETSLVGMNAKNIYLADESGQYKQLYDLCGEQLTVLYFFEPSCGHCQKTTPVLKDFYEKYKDDKRIKIISVYLLLDKKEWQDFIQKYGTGIFTNVWDPERISHYWEWFDTSTTPMMYVLDKDKKIIAKKIDVETLDMIVKYELK